MVGVDERRDAVAHNQVRAQMISPNRRLPGRHRGLAEVVVDRPRHVEEDRVALRTDKQRHVLIGSVASDAERIDHPRRKGLTAPIERAEMLAQPKEGFAGFQPRGQPAKAAGMSGRQVMVLTADIAVVRLIDEPLGTDGVLESKAKGVALDDERRGSGRYRPTGAGFLEIPVDPRGRLRQEQPGPAVRAAADVQPNDVGGHGPDLDGHPRPAIILGRELEPIAAPRRGPDSTDRVRIAGKEIGGGAGWPGGYQPRWIHSSRCGRSRPIVVGLPWPGSTWVSSGSTKSMVRMLSMMVGKLAYGFAVFPGPPGKSVSPEKRCSPLSKQMLPGVWPGVWIARTS